MNPDCAGPQFTDAGAKAAKAPPEGACPGGEANAGDAAPKAGFPKVGACANADPVVEVCPNPD